MSEHINELLSVIANPYFWVLFLGYYMAMAVISGMPMPDSTSSKGYQWAYRSLHIFSANINRVAASKLGDHAFQDTNTKVEVKVETTKAQTPDTD